MKTVDTCFRITYTPEQYEKAKAYVDDMKRHPQRVYWMGNRGKSDEELILSHIANRILSGFYNQYNPWMVKDHIISMTNRAN